MDIYVYGAAADTDTTPNAGQYRGRLHYQGTVGQCWNAFGQALETSYRPLYFLGAPYRAAISGGRIHFNARMNARQVLEALARYTPAAYTLDARKGLRNASWQEGRLPFPAAVVAQGRLTHVYATPECPCPLLGTDDFLRRNDAIRAPTAAERAERATECGGPAPMVAARPVEVINLPAEPPAAAPTEGGFPWWLLVVGGVTVWAASRDQK